MKAKISQDTEGVVLCFKQGPEGHVKVIWHFSIPKGVRHSSEKSNVVKKIMKPREVKWGTTKVVYSRVTSCKVHSWNLSLHEELVDTEFTRELIGLVRTVKHT